MTRYDVYLFLHIALVILWIGAGFAVALFAALADRAGDDVALAGAVANAAYLGQRLFGPASIGVVILGVLMVIDGPWEFDQLWITLGLTGFAFTALTGFLWFEPRSRKIAAMTADNGGTMPPQALLSARRMLAMTRADQAVLWLVVADMTFKPTSDDAGLLVAMALILVAALLWTRRAYDAVAAPPAAA